MKKGVIGLVALVLILATSCGKDNPTNPTTTSSSLAGTYTLESMTIQRGTTTITVRPPDLSGTLVLTGNRYSLTLTVPSEGFKESEGGSYTLSGSTITFRSDGGDSSTGNLSTDRRTITISDVSEGIRSTAMFVRK